MREQTIHREFIWRFDALKIEASAVGTRIELNDGNGNSQNIECKRLILAAGQGNRSLLDAMGREQPEMQLRPLQMVIVRGPLPGPVYAHCVDGAKTRVTITSHYDQQGALVWYLGGQLSEDGSKMSAEALLARAKAEMAELFPDIDWAQAEWSTLAIDRAEIRQPDGSRPANAYAEEQDGVITAWPTKLAFAPLVAAAVLKQLQADGITPSEAVTLPHWSHPGYAPLPWQEEEAWK